jgi:hypothetical protein
MDTKKKKTYLTKELHIIKLNKFYEEVTKKDKDDKEDKKQQR